MIHKLSWLGGDGMTRGVLVIAAVAVISYPRAFAQPAASPAFEAASVKPADPKLAGRSFPVSGGPGTSDPTFATFTNVSLSTMLAVAYDVRRYQISGPDWLDSARYTISARIPPGATTEQYHSMLRNLLAERFHIALHHESRQFKGYELVIGKNGSKLKESAEDSSGTVGPPEAGPPSLQTDAIGVTHLDRPGLVLSIRFDSVGFVSQVAARDRPVSALVDMLIRRLNQPVLDGTDLTANYDFILEFDGSPKPSPDDSAPDLLTALQEQLGLKLESRKLSLDMLIVNHADQIPTEN